MSALPVEAHAAALAGLAHLSPQRLRLLLERFDPAEAWEVVASGRAYSPPLPSTRRLAGGRSVAAVIADEAGRVDPARVWERCHHTGVRVLLLGSPDYPPDLAGDPEAPAVLFSLGPLAALDGHRVAVVGTRNATSAGRELAAELGAGLARHGVRVVSGLARGIDAYAHRGALADGGAPPVGVVGSGLDVVYPPEHVGLWQQVAEHGVLLAEVPPGTAPLAFRFPLRNRIIAALAHLLVVVESRARGGSLITAKLAAARGVPVLAVPGSPRNPAAEGVNLLLRDGCNPVLDVTDVLVALGFERPNEPAPRARRSRATVAADDRALLDLLGGSPLDLNRLVLLSGRSPADVALGVARLQDAGLVTETGGWFEAATSTSR